MILGDANHAQLYHNNATASVICAEDKEYQIMRKWQLDYDLKKVLQQAIEIVYKVRWSSKNLVQDIRLLFIYKLSQEIILNRMVQPIDLQEVKITKKNRLVHWELF